MRLQIKPLVTYLALMTLLLAPGCGGGDDDAAIPADSDRSESENGQPAADGTGSASKNAVPDKLHPRVVLETSMGRIVLRLDKERVSRTVDNFLDYIDQGHYDGTIFHQIIKENPAVVIGGAFTADRVEKPAGLEIRNEADFGQENRRGTVAMARQAGAIDSATCYFFINVADNQKQLDHQDRTPEGYGYCVFGEVIEGMDVVDKIAAGEVHDLEQFERIPVKTVLINSARRIQ